MNMQGIINSKITGAELIQSERTRQIEEENYSPEHDANHLDGELARAACLYVWPDRELKIQIGPHTKLQVELVDAFWPKAWGSPKRAYSFGGAASKNEAQLNNLIRAGALIAAEIDRRIANHENEIAFDAGPQND